MRTLEAGINGAACHEGNPDFYVLDDVPKGAAEGAEPEVERLVELDIGEGTALKQELARYPGIMAEKPVEQAHENLLAKATLLSRQLSL